MKKILILGLVLVSAGAGWLWSDWGVTAEQLREQTELRSVERLAATSSNTLVISQVYSGGGSNTSAFYQKDYVEIKNISNTTQSLANLALQYGSNSGNLGTNAAVIYGLNAAVVLQPGQYYLVALGTAGTAGTAVPSPDDSTTNLSMGASGGKVALTNTTTGLACGSTTAPCTLPDSRVIDLVGWGASITFEGSGAVPVFTTQQAAVRKNGGCTDTDDNNNDFDIVSSPVPRNSTTALAPCSSGTPTPTPTPSPTPAPAVTSVNPNSGPTTGGTSITITGTNFAGTTAVNFGGTAATTYTVNTATQITATSPAHSAGVADVTVTTTGGTSAISASDQFTYTAAPTPTPAPAVTSVSPNSGTTAGGTSVTITGTNFTGATAVSFGGTAAASFSVNSATSITAASPGHAAGTVDVTVTTSGGTSATSASDQFTYTTSPTPTPTPTPGVVQHVVDFDGDGKTDYSVIRNNGPGVPMTWWNLSSQTGALLNKDFGSYTLDFQEPADYDNDGHTDVAVWRPPNAGDDALWFILRSSDGTAKVTQFGSEGDDPDVVGDYDGDGKADIAVYRADLNTHLCTWWFRPSSGTLAGQNIPLQWGIAPDVDDIDIPIPGDFNHDGKADMAVARPSASGQATVWIHQGDGTGNINTVNTAQPWGHYATGDLTNADAYVPGDYDGDGFTDLAIARVVGNQWQWWIKWSTDGSIHVVTWGSSSDAIVQGDYDGDGRTDVATWRPLEGNFYVLSSKTGSPIVKQWGNGSTDVATATFNTH